MLSRPNRVGLTMLMVMLAGLWQTGRAENSGKLHLFILSGQSNMVGLNPDLSFTPTVRQALAPDQVLVVKDAVGGQPIRRWYKQWKPAEGHAVARSDKPWGDLYDRLMSKVRAALNGRRPDTVTFVWMQGERDARESHGQVYAASFRGLLDQLKKDLGRNDIGVVIGRLSDFDNTNSRYPHWTMVRQAQKSLAESDPLIEWVDTDDLNGPNNALHYTREGYIELGKRFAAKALALLGKAGPAGSMGGVESGAAGAGQPWCFVVAADPQLFWGPVENWEKTIAVVNELKPRFLVVVGDLLNRDGKASTINAQTDEKMARAYLETAAKLDKGIGLYNVAGNHDVGNVPTVQTLQWYEKRFGKLWYSFVCEDSLFVVLESNTLKDSSRAPGMAERQMAWLEQTLKQAQSKGYRHKVVFMHHPPCVQSVDEKQSYHNLPVERRKALLDMLARYGVEMIFCGHLHRNGLARVGPVQVVINGSCGKALGKDPLGIRIVKVWPERLEHTYRPLAPVPAGRR